MADPGSYARRSFVYRELAARGARFGEVAGAAVALDYGDPEAERRSLGTLGLCDLSPLPRTGFKGPAALDWLRAGGAGALERDNRAETLEDGALAARLAPTEALIVDGPGAGGDLCERLDAAHETAPRAGCHRVMRRDASFHFLLGGGRAADAMATLCGVDLGPRAFPEGSVAQTSVARMSMIVIAAALGGVRGLHLLGDSASASYAWSVLLDAMSDDGGVPVGLDAVRSAAGDGPGAG